MQVGQKVIHVSRRELGIGEVQAVDHDAVSVRFATTHFTGISRTALAPAESSVTSAPARVPSVLPALTPELHLKAVTERHGIPALWHITSRENVATILQRGLMSRHRVQQAGLAPVDISEASVQDHRVSKGTRSGLTLHDYVPLYLRARNPMLYCRRDKNATLCLLEVNTHAWLQEGAIFTDGNAASNGTNFYECLSDLRYLDWPALNVAYWNDVFDGKRKRCAEVLLPHNVPAHLIHRVHTATAATCAWLKQQGIDATHSPDRFF